MYCKLSISEKHQNTKQNSLKGILIASAFVVPEETEDVTNAKKFRQHHLLGKCYVSYKNNNTTICNSY